MAGVTNFLQTAIQIVTQATEADQAQKYDEAFRLYQLSLQYFQTALKYEKNERIKQTIRGKLEEYITRAEQLKDMLDKKKRKHQLLRLLMAPPTENPPIKREVTTTTLIQKTRRDKRV
jgi:vacuolar protein-sorting-associated protein 4